MSVDNTKETFMILGKTEGKRLTGTLPRRRNEYDADNEMSELNGTKVGQKVRKTEET